MFLFKKALIIIAAVCAVGCTPKPALEVSVLNRQVLKDVKSASGLEVLDRTLYVIGDNSPWLYKIDNTYKIEDRQPLVPVEGLADGVIPKENKPDFEAMAMVQRKEGKEFFIFGSGSKSPQRDKLIKLGLEKGEVKTYSLEAFYHKLKEAAKLDNESLNIEGAIIKDGKLFLFNRGENLILKYQLDDLEGFLAGQQDCPAPEVFLIDLPDIKGIKAGFSGASLVPGEDKALFTASVEDTEDWIKDGEVLGSFVGMVPLKNLKNGLKPDCVRLMDEGKPLNIKVESLAVFYPALHKDLRLLLVTDSDGGDSELLEANLHWR
ncbi:MAG: hypothetical protein KDD19_08695 [Phaeodactylibacter sp.]|nr:hypothetical protein [Phaeodactylibacter sp.]MCB9053206.1 hypothetical protein [Lewinellaceae bacterium]